MTPRKELFIKIKQALKTISTLELIALQRKQFSNPEKNYPSVWTAALIEIKTIAWESMVEQKQEGNCSVEITFYCKDGWLDQHDDTADDEHGLQEIDIIDTITEKLEALKGDYFKPLRLSNESGANEDSEIMSYTLTFTTSIYRRINPKYTNVNLTINQP